jgi:hypothetical protein
LEGIMFAFTQPIYNTTKTAARCLTGRLAQSAIILCMATGGFNACADEVASTTDASNAFAQGKGDSVSVNGEWVEVPNIRGSYAFELVSEVTTLEEGGFFSDDKEEISTTRLQGLVEVDQEDGALRLHLAACGIELPKVAGRKPTLNQDAIRNLEPISVSGELIPSEGDFYVRADKSALLVGLDLENPMDDELPSSLDDPRIVDADEDGKIGMTLRVSGFDIYGAIRMIFDLEGKVFVDGAIAGYSDVSAQTMILGDTVPFIDVRKEVKKLMDDTEVVSTKHRFLMKPIFGEGVSCEELYDREGAYEELTTVDTSTESDEEVEEEITGSDNATDSTDELDAEFASSEDATEFTDNDDTE